MHDLLIDRLGSQGDGMGLVDGKPAFVPLTVAGDHVKASGTVPRLELVEIVQPSKDRTKPLCQHFGSCGGCALQHVEEQAILAWKKSEVALALSQNHIDVPVDDTIATGPHRRRRVTFTIRRSERGVELGFLERAGSDLIALEECPILLPGLEQELEPLRDLTTTLLRGSEDIKLQVNACDNGLDLDFELEQEPVEAMLAAFVRAMARTSYLRASINGEVVVEKNKPFVHFGKAKVALPPGGFLQAVAEAEHSLAKLVTDHLKKSKRVVDLFSGSGTFALRLAERSMVHAVETEELALAALLSSQSEAHLKQITIEKRDLFELPLTKAELKNFDGICLDPPRSGALDQVQQIANSNVTRLAYVSCNPTTFARDAAVLIKGGYELERVVPVDQFVFSTHIEIVGLFSKKSDKAQRSIFR